MKSLKFLLFLCLVHLAMSSEDEDIEIDVEESNIDWSEEAMKSMPGFDQLIKHDCNTIRKFDWYNVEMEEWISQGRKWGKKLQPFVKYNYAYGIPIVGMEHFTDESMRRACYLIRYLFAGNEQFRRYAYWSQMMIKGQRGGVCCPPNVGVNQLSCPCQRERVYTEHKIKNNFPKSNIFAPAHEIAHWYIKRVLPKMELAGALKLPEFTNSAEWSWTKPTNTICKNTEEIYEKQGRSKMHPYLWNSLQQDHLKGTTKIDHCKTHHYFIYSGQAYLGLTGNGDVKKKGRAEVKAERPNLYKLLELLWPCNNDFLSICEDSAHGMTKGLAQAFIIGKSEEGNPSKMICMADVDKPEIEEKEVADLTPLPDDDVYEEGEYREWYDTKCKDVLKIGGWLALTKNNSIKKERVEEYNALPYGVVAESLKDSNEYGWWLRKCCRKTAKFETPEEKEKREEQGEK